MSSITLDISDENAITRGIAMLQRLLGNAGLAPAPAAAGSKNTAAPSGARGQTGVASTQSAAPAQAAHLASTAAGDAGNGTSAGSAGPASQPAAAGAQSSGGANAEAGSLDFDKDVKKPFLALSQSKGRPACESVLKDFALAKLSDAKPEQYAGLVASIKKAAQ